MVKGVVDILKEIVAFGGEYHIDANMKILGNGSSQADVWGFNIFLTDLEMNELNSPHSLISVLNLGIGLWKWKTKRFARKCAILSTVKLFKLMERTPLLSGKSWERSEQNFYPERKGSYEGVRSGVCSSN